ncbi:MAG: FAD-dependent oxidoreductase [Planctomycetota bacterium]
MTNSLGSESNPLRVAVVGSGPSAFYAVEALFKEEGLHVAVDVFDRLPTPYGLVRGGVAPDHQKIKSVVKVYEKIAANEGFRFFGNVKLGRDVQVEDLLARYHQVIYAVGNESDRRMGIPGEDLKGVFSATEFVGWYNGHPDFRDREFDLAGASQVAVVGNGNVAMDVSRIMVEDCEVLAKTDIADYAVRALETCKVDTVHLLGRRGPAQAAFSPKEIQEINKLEHVDVVVSERDGTLDDVSRDWMDQQSKGSIQRNVQFLTDQIAVGEGSQPKKVRCRFLVSPVEFLGDEEGHLRAVRIQHSELYLDEWGTPRPKGIEEFEEVPVQLAFKAVGYRGVPVMGVPFDERRGVIPNKDGRVLESADEPVLPRQYVVGWAKRGPTGLIGTNSPDSKATVAMMIEDLPGLEAEIDVRPEATVELLREKDIDFVSYQDWQALDRHEKAEGEKSGKVRQKVSDIGEMMEVVRSAR